MSAPDDPTAAEIDDLIDAADVELPDPEHARRCGRFAATLFDGLAPTLELIPEDRRVAIAAALFHDVGYLRGGRDHHRKSYDLVLRMPLPAMSPDDRIVAACAARYHGRTMPSIEHAGFGELGFADQRRVRRLAALTRVAAALDASHLGLVEEIQIDRAPSGAPILRVMASQEPAIERDRLHGAAGGFEALTGVPLRFEIARRSRTEV